MRDFICAPKRLLSVACEDLLIRLYIYLFSDRVLSFRKVLEIAERFTNHMELRTLASKLHVPYYKVEKFLQVNKAVSDAAFEVIQDWKGNTKDNEEAFKVMVQVLTKMNCKRILSEVLGV